MDYSYDDIKLVKDKIFNLFEDKNIHIKCIFLEPYNHYFLCMVLFSMN